MNYTSCQINLPDEIANQFVKAAELIKELPSDTGLVLPPEQLMAFILTKYTAAEIAIDFLEFCAAAEEPDLFAEALA